MKKCCPNGRRREMSVRDHLSAFARDVAMILEEYQIQCQAMAVEATVAASCPPLPTVSLGAAKANAAEAPKKFASAPVYSAEEVARHPAEWFDERLVALAARTRRPLGPDFRKKLRYIFPSIPSHEMVHHISRLVAAGRIKNRDAQPSPPAPGEQPEKKEGKPTE